MIAATTNKNNLNSDYTTKKSNTELLNSKLNQILQILQSLNNSRINSLKSYYNLDKGVNQLNSDLDTARQQLIDHSRILKNASM
jgi:predicted nuclease with TOPRIM domain